jgi:hypothetical protein
MKTWEVSELVNTPLSHCGTAGFDPLASYQ